MPKQAERNFTDKYIQGLKPEPQVTPGKRAKMYFVREGRGFSLRVLPSGLKTFFYIYEDNGRKYYKIGHYGRVPPDVTLAEARAKYQEVYNLHKQGYSLALSIDEHNVLEPQPYVPVLFKDFAKDFLAAKAQAKPSVSLKYLDWLEYALDADVLPYWGNRPIKDITRRDAIELLERVAKRAPGQTKNVLTAAQGVMQYAVDRDYCTHNVLRGLSNTVTELRANPRSRVLSEDEIRTIWNTLTDNPSHRALKLILLTAQRPGEVAGMTRKEITGGTEDIWTIPPERAEKAHREHMVPLTKTAIDIIGDAPGSILGIKRNSISQAVQRGLQYCNLPRWTPHDLRRTARTYMAKLGVLDEHAEAVLNHAKQGMVGVYNKYQYLDEKRVALELWEQELLRILRG